MNVERDTDSKLKPAVVLTGTAKEGKVGPPLGMVDIGVSESAYLFQVALPGNLKCDVQIDGRVYIAGKITGSEVLKNSSTVYDMKVQQLCPPGPFSISFNLPGPVDTRLVSHNFRPDGILEVIVMKYRIPVFAVDGWQFPPS
ncbi:hypothetical protein RJ639_022107 [Escallonia herrerae]|uniref:Uncharacterized protein n=1 Tax=Escallonia herrerae TaxID=1293975 RepID=A0AA88V603_9ASTE|nr:hypothetical protein RJ639_022107 [Escallonia herrerae]